jgi:hypothetical protein
MILGASAVLVLSQTFWAQSQPAVPVILDRVVAVVNNEAILTSDIENEIRLSALEPTGKSGTTESQLDALQRLISRVLIRQQMDEEGAQMASITPAEVAARLQLLRKDLPECSRFECRTDAGWNEFLRSHDLTADEVNDYLHTRLAILHFIELRFRQGIRISHEEIESYYKDLLVPQYSQGEKAPPIDQVEPRIEEILLQQRVNALFGDWLNNLRKQGQIEVLDPQLESAIAATAQGAGTR